MDFYKNNVQDFTKPNNALFVVYCKNKLNIIKIIFLIYLAHYGCQDCEPSRL